MVADAGMGSSRRGLLKGAAGIAAVATAGGFVTGPNVEASAPAGSPRPQNPRPLWLSCVIPSISPVPFELFYMTWGATVQVSSTGGQREAGAAPSLTTVRIGKRTDGNSNSLVREMLAGTVIPKVDIIQEVREFGIQRFELTNVLVASIGTQGADNDANEELELSYQQVRFVRPSSEPVTYNLATRAIS